MTSYLAYWLTSLSLLSAHYQQPPEQARWVLVADPFFCQLQQQVTGLGRVQFMTAPAEPLTLQFEFEQPNLHVNSAQLQVIDADWQAPALRRGGTIFSASAIAAQRIEFREAPLLWLQQLHLGYWLLFEFQTDDTDVRLTLTSIEGRQAVDGFRQCVTKMAPLTWQQARDLSLEMQRGQRTLSSAQQTQLRQLVSYLQYDKAVQRILIDGHADDTGDQLADRLLSRERADDAAAYFLELGVKAAMLEVRAHGNRYPVAANQPNRRVVVRLIR